MTNLERIKRLLILSAALLCIPVIASATKVYKVNNIWYELSGEESAIATCGPSTEGKDYDGDQYAGAIVIPEKVKISGKDRVVSGISGAFHYAAKKVTSVTLSELTTYVMPGAFEGCTELVSVTLSNNTKAIGGNTFQRAAKLKRVTYKGGPTGNGLHLPSTVTAIGDNAFAGCKVLFQGSFTLPAQIRELGSGAFYGCESLTKFTFPPATKITKIPYLLFTDCINLKSIEYSTPFTSIGEWAFQNCTNLNTGSTFKLPNGLVTLGKSAFEGSGVKEVNATNTKLTEIPESAFMNCKNLVDISLPSTLTTIGTWAFSGCTNLSGGSSKIIIIPNGVTKIGTYAFYKCPSLPEVTIQENVETIGNYAFSGCTALEKINFSEGKGETKLKSIGGGAFSGCKALKQLILPNNIETLAGDAFAGCSSLQNVSFRYKDKPTSLSAIGGSAFEGCTNLITFAFQEGITTIGPSAFADCSSLTRADFPETLSLIDGKAFARCIGLKEASAYLVDVITIAEDAFNGAGITKFDIRSRATEKSRAASRSVGLKKGFIIGDYAFANCANLESLPKHIISLGARAFENCTGLKNINFSDSLTVVGGSVFRGCTSFTEVILPDTIMSVGGWAFYGCEGLRTVSLGKSEWDKDYADERILTIGVSAFNGCTNIESVISYFAIPPQIQKSEFRREAAFSESTYKSAVLSVPAGSGDAYRQHEVWKQFVNIVERADPSSIDGVEADTMPEVRFVNGRLLISGMAKDAMVSVYTMDGRLVLSGYGADALPPMAHGIYIVHVDDKNFKLINR